MFPFRLQKMPGNCWPDVPRAAVAPCWAAYLALDRSQWLSPAEIVVGQLSQLRLLLHHCREHVPYYQRLLAEAGITPDDVRTMADVRRLPLLLRRIYQEQYAHFHTRSLPQGTTATGEVSTSGSSGIPVKVQQTNVVQMWWLALILRDYEWCGIDPTQSLAAIRYLFNSGERGNQYRQGVTTDHWHRGLHQLIETGPCHLMEIHQDPHRQLEWLRERAPKYLLSYPANLEFLASLIRESGEPLPGLLAIQAISESLTDEARRLIESSFGVPVWNTYSCSEAGYLASPCPQGHGLHVHSESVLIEILDESNQPCVPGQEGRVVLTSLHNFLTPLIRYDILDRAIVGAINCPCGRGLPLLTRLMGKERPLFHLPNGCRKNSNHLAFALRKIGGLHQFRITQRAIDLLLVQLVPDQSWSDQHRHQIRVKVDEFFEGPIRIEIEILNRLESTASGKSVDVVCEVN